ncbi:nuclear transport factor 2 family protein [Planococcus shenhongbingii]|uniref:nuclear transport factor 2 family protein n=1 Tax=Planococcus shenhongbingii TaxID=3058398 RepID=UPI00262ECA79|nr:nuclear transport factor 2 family protein [Planococcus sp. N016]WKA56878.1 nuclear transport factor 2 family protein [Planococcus sp. N016]
MADVKSEKFFKEMNIAFVIGDLDFIEKHIADDITWEMEGEKTIRGKEEFLSYVGAMDTNHDVKVTIDKVRTEGLQATVSGKMMVNEKDGNVKSYSYQDIYEVNSESGGKITNLISVVNEDK